MHSMLKSVQLVEHAVVMGVCMFSIQKALVTGGSSGIGKAIVDSLLREGCEVISVSRTVLPVTSFATGGALHQIACDITDDQALGQAFEKVSTLTSSLDILFSNAGYGIAGAIADTPKELVARQFDVNLFSSIEVIRNSLAYLEAAKGRIILTSSVAAVVSLPYQSFYSCTKASLNMLALALNTELKQAGIRVIAVMPGDVATPFTNNRDKYACPEATCDDRCGQSIAKMEHDERTGAEPEVIAKRIIRIAKKGNPKPLYGLGFFYRSVLVVFKILPVRLSNLIIGWLYG